MGCFLVKKISFFMVLSVIFASGSWGTQPEFDGMGDVFESGGASSRSFGDDDKPADLQGSAMQRSGGFVCTNSLNIPCIDSTQRFTNWGILAIGECSFEIPFSGALNLCGQDLTTQMFMHFLPIH